MLASLKYLNHPFLGHGTHRMDMGTSFSFFSRPAACVDCHRRSRFASHPSFFRLLLAADKERPAQSRGTGFSSCRSLICGVWILHAHQYYSYSLPLLISFLGYIGVGGKSIRCFIFHSHTQDVILNTNTRSNTNSGWLDKVFNFSSVFEQKGFH